MSLEKLVEVKLSRLLSSSSEEGAAPVVVSIRDRGPRTVTAAAGGGEQAGIENLVENHAHNVAGLKHSPNK